MSKISVYMTGGIAAYKAVMAVRGLQKAGHQVRVAMTRNAEEFVGVSTLAALTKTPVLDDLFADSRRDQIAHIELADWSDLTWYCRLTPTSWLRWPMAWRMMPCQPRFWPATAQN